MLRGFIGYNKKFVKPVVVAKNEMMAFCIAARFVYTAKFRHKVG